MAKVRFTRHEIRAALVVANLIDQDGTVLDDARRAYTDAITQGIYSIDDLQSGECLLVKTGLLKRDRDMLVPTAALLVLNAVNEQVASLILDSLLKSTPDYYADPAPFDAFSTNSPFDLQSHHLLGEKGELLVVNECIQELVSLGREDLAPRVQRVSLISPSLGFDVVAPSRHGNARLLEVKTQSGPATSSFRLFLTRNEFEVGRRNSSWALMACVAPEGPGGSAQVLGWCRAAALLPYLPADAAGRWTEALVHLPISNLNAGLPGFL